MQNASTDRQDPSVSIAFHSAACVVLIFTRACRSELCEKLAISRNHTRRGFLADVGRGTLLATLGPAMLTDLGLAPKAFADELESPLRFGELEPLVCARQETPVEQLQLYWQRNFRRVCP